MRNKLMTAMAALLLIACADEPTTTTFPGGTAGVRMTQAVTGDFTVDLTSANAGYMTYSVSGHLRADGSADGTFTGSRAEAAGTVVFSGRVTCLAFDAVNHRAWIGGVVTENASTSPFWRDGAIFQPGKDIWFRVVDYGEGSTDPNDRSTTFGFQGSGGIQTSPEYCATMPWPMTPVPDARTFPVSGGNVQVHDQ